jgi:hypothetical protein
MEYDPFWTIEIIEYMFHEEKEDYVIHSVIVNFS